MHRYLFYAIVLLYLFISFLSFNQIEEDAFIYFRFAANIAEGHGYVFNIGGEQVESGSSLLWQLLLAVVYMLPCNIIIATKFLGIGFGCLAVWLTYAISRKIIADEYLQAVPALLLSVSVPFYCWAQRGLETPFYLCCLLALAYFCTEKRLTSFWYLPAFLVFCSRPEGFFMLLALIPFFVTRYRTIRNLRAGIGIFLCLCCGIMLFRILYFHDLVPHPFYIKMVSNVRLRLHNMMDYIQYSKLLWFLLPPLCMLFAKSFWKRGIIPVLALLLVCLAWFFMAMDFNPYYRFIVPVLPFLFICSAALYDALGRYGKLKVPVRLWVYGFAGVLLLFAIPGYAGDNTPRNLFAGLLSELAASPGRFVGNTYKIMADPDSFSDYLFGKDFFRDTITTNYQVSTGRFIRQNYPENITVIYDQMGQTPWYAGLDKRFVDSLGLVNKRVGFYTFNQRFETSVVLKLYRYCIGWLDALYGTDLHAPRDEAQLLDWVFNQKPELILINKVVIEYGQETLSKKIARDPRLRRYYEPVYRLDSIVTIYQKKNMPVRELLRIPDNCSVVRIGDVRKPGGGT